MTVSFMERYHLQNNVATKNFQVRKQTEFALPLLIILFIISITAYNPVCAQEKNLIQVKTFDLELNPIPSLSVSINGGEFILMDKKGVGFVEMFEKDLPPKTVTIKNEDLEAESWNFSRGILEIIIRTKNTKVLSIRIVTKDNKPLKNIGVVYYGKEVITLKTNSKGVIEIPLALNEKVISKEQFNIKAYNVTSMTLKGKDKTLTVESRKANSTTQTDSNYFENFDLKNLDSIQSLTVFYAVFKNYPIGSLDDDMKQRIEAKFNELVSQLKNAKGTAIHFTGSITDSSLVSSDIQNLLAQAKAENLTLEQWRTDFDDKIKIINKKLEDGVENLNEDARIKILQEINLLERLLEQNEKKFYKNLTDYRGILGLLKEKLVDVKNLQDMLYVSEAQRQADKDLFQQRLTLIIILTSCFSLIAIAFIYFSIKLKQKQKELLIASEQVNKMNETLESLVQERTKSLKTANEEMDVFLYRASHDLRGPIVSILGICNLAKQSTNMAESFELFEKTASTAFRMDRMLKKLQLIKEINQPQDLTNLNLSSKIQSFENIFEEHIKQFDISYSVHVPDTLTLNTYPKLIEIILVNLIENALFYGGLKNNRKGEIKVSATKEIDSIKIEIYDNGIGIDKKNLDTIWDMFYVGDEHSKGNGLGLYVVLKAITALNATIFVESEKNVYTKFILHFPDVTNPRT